MKLTAKGRYAVMALADLASQGQDAVVPLSDISDRQGISLAYLEQIFTKLRRAELVTSHRGTHGGYGLKIDAEHLSLDQIIQAVDEDIKVHGCAPETKKTCTGQNHRCLTHNLWGALEGHIESFLAQVTVADVIEERFPVSEVAE